ncbi:MAG: FecR domain-containing protein [Elusimicrobia bacterium]|nr:FecR domain-containing protein [Elusimicrobiota bacterium]
METLKVTAHAVWAALFLAQAAWAAAPSAVILVPRGSVDMRASASDKWAPVAGRTELGQGYEVRTRANAAAELTLSDGSKVALGPSSVFTLETLDRRESLFNLAAGKLRAFISGFASSRVRVRTPTAVASVRGTEFELSSSQGLSEMSVAEGHLEVQDNAGHNAVLTSEETLSVRPEGMDKPKLVSLKDERARDAARPIAVAMEMARDQTRSMLEDMRNRELKANEAQLGKDVIDAFGNRVRIEEYLLRPAANEFKLLFLSFRDNRFDWGHLIERFKYKIPDDLTQVAAIIAGSYFSRTMPSNWIKYIEAYLTNTVDAVRETITYGDPVAINFSGFGAGIGTRYYPASIDYVQTLMGPGIAGGSKVMFQLTQDYGTSTVGQMSWRQQVRNAGDVLTTYAHLRVDPTNAAAVANLNGGDGCGSGCYLDDAVGLGFDPDTRTAFPSGPGKADFLSSTKYANGDTVSVEKLLVSNDGEVFDFRNPTSDTFTKEGNYNLEIVVNSSLFQGRKIDVLIAPEILSATKQGKTDSTKFTPR